ncbi:MAG: hypothetical protein HYY17_03460 [Planctomycetes bacterium]|nr:hypothetical protein [Planctomycetota bacterium]
MTEELRLPAEGMNTLGAQFAKSTITKIASFIVELKKQGWPEDRIFQRLQKDLKGIHPHNLKRLFDKAVGNPVDDDIRAENVVKEEQVRETTVRLRLKKPSRDVDIDLIVQYRGQDWYVAGFDGTNYILRRIE